MASDWLSQCVLSAGKNPKPLAVLVNAIVALRNDPAVMDMLVFDAFENQVKLLFPVGRPDARFDYPVDITDEDYTELQAWMQRAGLKLIARNPVVDACAVVARDRTYHPVRDWLDGLQWDGENRCAAWLMTMLGAGPDPVDLERLDPEDREAAQQRTENQLQYLSRVGQMFLISMVARIYDPGCKVDHMLILEGPQGALKSSACRALAAPWFSDALPDIAANPKDASLQLRGVWLQEVPELNAFRGGVSGSIKSFIDRQVERFRPPFGRATVAEPRQCCFIGTTNLHVYLHDETGGRRVWPVRVGTINLDAIVEQREQLFAEAVCLYREGTSWWPDAVIEQSYIVPEQDARYEGDAWEQAVADYCQGLSTTRTADVATRALGIPLERLTPQSTHRISAIMRSFGWIAKNRKGRGRYWERPRRPPTSETTLTTVESS